MALFRYASLQTTSKLEAIGGELYESLPSTDLSWIRAGSAQAASNCGRSADSAGTASRRSAV